MDPKLIRFQRISFSILIYAIYLSVFFFSVDAGNPRGCGSSCEKSFGETHACAIGVCINGSCTISPKSPLPDNCCENGQDCITNCTVATCSWDFKCEGVRYLCDPPVRNCTTSASCSVRNNECSQGSCSDIGCAYSFNSPLPPGCCSNSTDCQSISVGDCEIAACDLYNFECFTYQNYSCIPDGVTPSPPSPTSSLSLSVSISPSTSPSVSVSLSASASASRSLSELSTSTLSIPTSSTPTSSSSSMSPSPSFEVPASPSTLPSGIPFESPALSWSPSVRPLPTASELPFETLTPESSVTPDGGDRGSSHLLLYAALVLLGFLGAVCLLITLFFVGKRIYRKVYWQYYKFSPEDLIADDEFPM